MAEDDLESAKQEGAQRSQSNWMLAFGVVLLLLAGYGASQSADGVPAGVFLFGLLAAALIVLGLVTRR